MKDITRKQFLGQVSAVGASFVLFGGCDLIGGTKQPGAGGVSIGSVNDKETIFSYMQRANGGFKPTLYRQLIGAANEFKEGDEILKVAAANDRTRNKARALLSNTTIGELSHHALYTDELYELIKNTTTIHAELPSWTMEQLKEFVLTAP